MSSRTNEEHETKVVREDTNQGEENLRLIPVDIELTISHLGAIFGFGGKGALSAFVARAFYVDLSRRRCSYVAPRSNIPAANVRDADVIVCLRVL